MRTITEPEYFEAIRVITQYREQIKNQTEKALKTTIATKTPAEIRADWNTLSPMIDTRLFNILLHAFIDKRICDITKKQLLSVRGAGLGCWIDLCYLTGNNEFPS